MPSGVRLRKSFHELILAEAALVGLGAGYGLYYFSEGVHPGVATGVGVAAAVIFFFGLVLSRLFFWLVTLIVASGAAYGAFYVAAMSGGDETWQLISAAITFFAVIIIHRMAVRDAALASYM
jgi:hypothetical protein